MKEEKKRHRIISYCLFGLFILSLVTIFFDFFSIGEKLSLSSTTRTIN